MERPLPTRPAPDLRRRRRQLARFFPGTRLAARLEVLPDLGLVYVRNPKVATSTMLLWLDWLQTGERRPPGHDVRHDNAIPSARRTGWDRVMRMLDGEAFRFTFVRDPVARFESAYHSKVLRPTVSRGRVLAQLGRDEDDAAPIGFEEFLSAVEQEDPLHMDLHWRPQHLNLMHPILTFDLVGRLERFDEDIEVVRRRLDLPAPPAQSRNVARTDRPSQYDGRPDLVERVQALYARDRELYGY